MDHFETVSDASPVDVGEAVTAATWGQERRLEFLDFRLRWEKTFNRSDLTSHFGISVPQASLDISKYAQLAPDNLLYDRRSRIYRATDAHQPVVGNTSPQRYLNELLACANGVLRPSDSYVGWAPPLAVVPVPTRLVDSATLSLLLDAIRYRTSVRITYQSDADAEPLARVVSPHAFAFDGFRWHARAYCYYRENYRDFVLGRILNIATDATPGRDPRLDSQWNTSVRLVITANPDRSEGNRRAIERDYSMIDGFIVIEVRMALLYYVLKELELGPFATLGGLPPQIVLTNEDELSPYIDQIFAARHVAEEGEQVET